ncbi:Abi-alpha family protein [Actinophytocola sp.]|uniref:Abi-alpha family protein n=1 Tax=Actinophytocola sp. TaxID=1872138 RepID=UPI002D7FF600|nr:Abi-alpha family protein [Actinophytocola sp.]HET9141046.1 Abi-alpha family protein [Actinophytocola sp.]
MTRDAKEPEGGLTGLVRLAVGVSWHAFTWTVGTSLHVGTEVVRRTLRGESPTAVLHDVSLELRSVALRALGLDPENGTSAQELQALGENLLRRSADVTVTEEGHPAYARILSELAPDEARILRYLYLHGPQPSIDVRTNRPLGIGSELVAGGLNMIAEHAGCRHTDRIHPYLTNLNRLGLVTFSKEQVANPNRYQLVEAQPHVADVIHRAGRAPRIIHRSIHLNSFGADFVVTCLPTTNGSHPPAVTPPDAGT